MEKKKVQCRGGEREEGPDRLDIEIACDGDLNVAWERDGSTPSPRQRLTILDVVRRHPEMLKME